MRASGENKGILREVKNKRHKSGVLYHNQWERDDSHSVRDELFHKSEGGDCMRRLLKTSEVAARLNVSEQMVRKLINTGVLEAAKIGNLWRIFPESVDMYTEAQGIFDDDGM